MPVAFLFMRRSFRNAVFLFFWSMTRAASCGVSQRQRFINEAWFPSIRHIFSNKAKRLKSSLDYRKLKEHATDPMSNLGINLPKDFRFLRTCSITIIIIIRCCSSSDLMSWLSNWKLIAVSWHVKHCKVMPFCCYAPGLGCCNPSGLDLAPHYTHTNTINTQITWRSHSSWTLRTNVPIDFALPFNPDTSNRKIPENMCHWTLSYVS